MLNKGEVEAIGDSQSMVERYYKSEKSESYLKEHSKSDIFVKQVYPVDSSGNPRTNFAHSEEIRLRIVIGVNNYSDVQNIGVCLLRMDKSRVFTVNKSLRDLYQPGRKEIVVDFIIEGKLIAPMDYSFLLALNMRSGQVTYDMLPDICPIRVFDDGTDMAFAEGADYGVIILKDKWQLSN